MANDPNPNPDPDPTPDPDPDPDPDPTPDPDPDPDDPAQDDGTDWKAEARKWEKRAKDNSDAAERLKEIEDAQKTEQEKLAEELETERSERQKAEAEAAKYRAATKHGLSEDDLELLGTGTPEEIEQRAERLAERLADAEGKKPVVPSSRHQGGGGGAPEEDVDEVVESIPPGM